MRAYVVKNTQNGVKKFAGTQAEVKLVKEELIQGTDVSKKDLEVEEIDIPMAKAELLGFINNLLGAGDQA